MSILSQANHTTSVDVNLVWVCVSGRQHSNIQYFAHIGLHSPHHYMAGLFLILTPSGKWVYCLQNAFPIYNESHKILNNSSFIEP